MMISPGSRVGLGSVLLNQPKYRMVLLEGLTGYIYYPRNHFLSITPPVTPIQPCAMLIWDHAFRNAIRASHGGACVAEYTGVVVFLVNYEVMRRDAELSAVVVIAAVACYDSYKLDPFGFTRRSERKGRVLAVIMLVECSSSKQWNDLERGE